MEETNVATSNYLSFNLNERFLVRLTDLGYQLLADRHNAYLGTIKNWEFRTADYYKDKADENRYTSFQAWDFIKTFGEVTGMAKPQYYHLDILIAKKYLSELP